jgi:hypothetical protein
MKEQKAIQKIVDQTGYSVGHVRAVIAGRRNNKEIFSLFSKFTAPRINKKFPWGAITEIAYRTGYSAAYVSQVLAGKRSNKTISATAKQYKKH